MSEGTRCRIYRRLYFATPRVSNVEKLLWGGNSQEFPNCRRPGTDRWLRSKGRAALNFREPSTRFRHCCSRNRRHISVTSLPPSLPLGLAVVGGLHFRKVSYVTQGRVKGEKLSATRLEPLPLPPPPPPRLKFENRFYRGWNLPRLFFFFSKCNSRIVYVDD